MALSPVILCQLTGQATFIVRRYAVEESEEIKVCMHLLWFFHVENTGLSLGWLMDIRSTYMT